ncbi:MAG: hypothetical protein CBC35_04545 [Planctomycetes bacterium TMED75]|nr:hypothetical protein [Planctomycetaceae bacterium]OUU94133.1 MAG: hypothetical protein CBC35_04545 [Planctomycetes bacterium TMED75]
MTSVSISIPTVTSVPSMKAAWTMRIALGFMLTVMLWGVCYFVLMGPGSLGGDFLFGLMLFLLLPCGFLAGRWRTVLDPTGLSGFKSGFFVGLMSAIFNLLIVGSMFPEGSGPLEVTLWVSGLLLASSFCTGLGGLAGGTMPADDPRSIVSPLGLFSAVLAAAVLLLLSSGGLVTGLEAGLAVPDWPGSFGHNMLLYPMREMTSDTGVFFEHAHRLYGMLVGTGVVALLCLVFINDRRSWLRMLSILLFVMVCIQGLMGGLRVTETSTFLALVHGVFGQLVFALTVLISCFTMLRWTRGPAAVSHEAAAADRPITVLLVAALVCQLVLGASVRHFQVLSESGQGLELPVWAVVMHVTMGVLAFALALLIGIRAGGNYRSFPILRVLGISILIVVVVQLVLGIIALFAVSMRQAELPPVSEVVFTSLHQATGALLLGLCVLLMAWHFRLVKPAGESS